MKLNVHNLEGQVTGEVEVSDEIFGIEPSVGLVWEVVRWQRAKKHRGTHAAKTRHAVKGSTQKMYRQKGTGRARHGAGKSNVHVGGGVAHGPSPRSHSFKVNRKARSKALRQVLSQKFTDEQIKLVDSFDIDEIKTKRVLAALECLGVERSLVIDADNRNLNLSIRNLAQHDYLNVAGLNVYDLLNHGSIVLTTRALSAVEGRLATS